MGMREDDDIKIAPDSFSGVPKPVDSGEEAARQFLEQKNCGNIDKARELGRIYADAAINIENGPIARGEKPETQRELHHQLLLYSYIVNRIIAERAPNSIVAQTCLNVFYTEIEASSQELHSHVSDMAAFSLYVLWERTNKRAGGEIGAIYAKLCDFGGDRSVIDEGNTFYERVTTYCLEKINEIGFVR